MVDVTEKMKKWLKDNGFIVVENGYVPHTEGLLPYRVKVYPKVDYSDGATYVFIDDRVAFVATLPTPTLRRNWRIIAMTEYETKEKLLAFLNRFAKKVNEKSAWDD